jgi:hypothetical protein
MSNPNIQFIVQTPLISGLYHVDEKYFENDALFDKADEEIRMSTIGWALQKALRDHVYPPSRFFEGDRRPL